MARPDWMTGKTVQDATKRITINIRQEDIDGADPLDGGSCVAARCTLNALRANQVYFYRSKAYVQWDDDDVILRYQLSSALVRDVIEILDDPHRDNGDIKRGTYDLLPPPPGQKLGLDRRPKNPGARPPHPEHATHHVMGRVTAARHR